MGAHARDARPDAELDQSRAAFAAALERGDAKAVAAIYAEDAKLLPPTAELLYGRDAIEAFWRAGIESGIAHVERESLELDRYDGLVHEIGRYTLRLEPADGQPVLDRGKYLVAHARQDDGSWRWVVEMFNPEGGAT